MSSENEEIVSVKSDKDLISKPRDSNVEKIIPAKSSKDQVDHAVMSTGPQIDQSEPSVSVSKTDSGFNDPGTAPKDTDVDVDSSDDEDLHLQWDDDETDEQELLSAKNTKKTESGKVEADIVEDESLDENLLLESSDEAEKNNDLVTKDDESNLEKDTELAESDVEELLNSDNDTEIQPKLTTSDVSDKNIDKDIPIPTPKEAKKTESEEVTNKSKAKNEAAKEMGNVQDESLINNSGPTTSSPNESFCNTSLEANADSGFKKPDVMLEIPTQEIIDILDDTDISITCTNDGDIEMETKDEPNKAMVINEKSDKSESGKSENNEKEEIAIELNPTVTFEIDSNKPNDSESTNIQPVSEDDWSEIERRLENFETSLVGESEVKEGDKEKTNVGIEASVASTQNKPIEEGHSKSNSSPTESKEDDLKPKPDPEFEVKKISMTELMKTMVASEATTESSVVCQSLPVTAVDNSIIEASAQALSLSSNKKMVVSGVTMEVRKDDLNIRKDLQVHPPIPIEKLLTSEQGIEESTSPDMGTELPVVEKMDVDPSILDIDVKPVDLDGNTSMDLDDDQNAEALEITEEDYKEEDTKKSDIEINSNTESKETFKTSLEEIKTTEIESTVNIAKISEESNIEVDPPIQSTKESSESQLQKEKILETSPVTLISENVQTSPKSLSKVTVSKVSETAKTLVGKEITVKSSSKLDTTVSELEKSPTKRVEASLNKKDSANRTSKVNMEAENNSTDISTDVNSSKPTPDLASELPSTSKAVVNPVIEVSEQPSTSKLVTEEIKPSTKTSKPSNSPTDDTKLSEAVHPSPAEPSQSLDTDDIAEVTDSLGLLAESSRTMEDDEEPEEFEEDDDDFYPDDESSNQMTAEHSEDSNQQNSETEAQKEAEEKETEVESPQEEKGQGEFDLGEGYGAVEKDEDTNMSEIVCEEESHEIAEKAVESLDVEKTSEAKEEKQDLVDKPEMETVRLSDTSDEEGKADASTSDGLPNKETTDAKATKTDELAEKISPKKTLEVTKQNDVMSFVDLEESSSEDDVQEVKKEAVNPAPEKKSEPIEGAHIPEEIEVTPVVEDKVEEIVSTTADKKVTEIPESKDTDAPEVKTDDQTQPKHKFGLEIFNLDSDEEEPVAKPPPVLPIETRDAGGGAEADASAATAILVNGIKDLTPLLDMHMGSKCSDLVEISDSETDDDEGDSAAPREPIGHVAARFIEAELAKTFNETWLKYKMDSRLGEAEDTLSKEMLKLEEETKEIDAMLSECQAATDRLRNELYATFEQNRQELNPLIIYDTPSHKYICSESAVMQQESPVETRAKRRMSSASESSAKRAAIPMGYTPLDNSDSKWGEPTVENTKADDDKDISVLQVSAESAPADLPPPGELIRPPLRVDDAVYAMRNSFGTWAKARVLEVQPKGQGVGGNQNFTVCRVKLVSRTMHKAKLLPARWLAYSEPANVRMTIGTRLIALFKDPLNRYQKETFYSGIVAEVPNPVNNYRYLVFFDDGYAQYVRHRDTRPVCECSALVWEEVHPFSREFVRKYLIAYPERPMVRLHAGQTINTELNGKWLPSRVNRVDASLVQVMFEMDGRTEWIYRGSTRLAPLYKELQAAERRRARPMPRTKVHPKMNMPYVEYTRSEEQGRGETIVQHAPSFEREIRQRAVAKKSTSAPPVVPAPTTSESVTSRVVYYTPKNSVKPYKMSPHTCGPHCKRTDTFTLKELRTYNPLAKPLLSGWERQIVRYNGCKEVMYRAPCGRRLRCVRELHRYLRAVHSDMPVDLFDFTPATHCLAEFVLNKCLVGKKDLSHGKENVPVPCVNYYDDSLPEFCSYNTERTPTAGVPLNLDPEFLCGCDCTDDCEDKSKCACWKMTLEGARTIGLRGARVGYAFRRLPEPLPSGIYECNSRCKCKQTCLNRVAQQPLQLKLQDEQIAYPMVFKTLNRGWGIRALNDVPKGSFLCVYAGNLLTDATANMDGLNEGDEYLAELDYIEVVEQMKEGYEEDVPEEDKKLDKKNVVQAEDAESSSSEEEGAPSKNEMDDGDFCPGHIGVRVTQFSKRLRKRGKNKKEKDDGAKEKGATKEKATAKDGDKPEDDCITISDDEEVREPSRFMAQDGMESQEFVSKYKSVRTLFGKDEACYIMDAKVQGNIGRYLNHSCMPNVFVQNVFVDTHDPRFPWVAFFALSHIKAGTELTWNYNYDVGSVPGKTLYCYCGAPNCRGRLL